MKSRGYSDNMAKSVAMARRWLEVGVVSLLLTLCLSGDVLSPRFDNLTGSIPRDISCALHDPGAQWMVFLCAGMYFVTFTLLRQRRGKPPAGEDGGLTAAAAFTPAIRS